MCEAPDRTHGARIKPHGGMSGAHLRAKRVYACFDGFYVYPANNIFRIIRSFCLSYRVKSFQCDLTV